MNWRPASILVLGGGVVGVTRARKNSIRDSLSLTLIFVATLLGSGHAAERAPATSQSAKFKGLHAQKIDPKPSIDDFLNTMIEGLVFAQNSEDRISPADSATSETGGLANRILEIKLAQKDLMSGVEVIRRKAIGNRKVDDEDLGDLAALVTMTSLLEILEVRKKEAGLIVSILDGKGGGAGQIADASSDLRMKEVAAWDNVLMAVASMTHALTQLPEGKEEKLSRLKLSNHARCQAMSRLEARWGPDIKKGMQTGQLKLAASASALYGFISDPQWRSNDGSALRCDSGPSIPEISPAISTESAKKAAIAVPSESEPEALRAFEAKLRESGYSLRLGSPSSGFVERDGQPTTWESINFSLKEALTQILSRLPTARQRELFVQYFPDYR